MIRRLYFILLISAMLVVGRSVFADVPEDPAYQVSTNDVSKTSATVTWYSGEDAYGAIVVVRTSSFDLNNSSHLPVNGTSYSGANYSSTESGGYLSFTDSDCDNIDAGKVIFNSYQDVDNANYPNDDDAFTIIINDLTPGERYYLAVFEMDSRGGDQYDYDYNTDLDNAFLNPISIWMVPPDVEHLHAIELTDQNFLGRWVDITETECEECTKYRITYYEEGNINAVSQDVDFEEIYGDEEFLFQAGIDENLCYSYTIRAVHGSQVVEDIKNSPYQPVTTLPVPNDYTTEDFNTPQTYDVDEAEPTPGSMIWYKTRANFIDGVVEYNNVVDDSKNIFTYPNTYPIVAKRGTDIWSNDPLFMNEVYACSDDFHEFYAGNVKNCEEDTWKFAEYLWSVTGPGGNPTYYRQLPSKTPINTLYTPTASDDDAIAVRWNNVGGIYTIAFDFTDAYDVNGQGGNTGSVSREIYVIGAPTFTTNPQNKLMCDNEEISFYAYAYDGGVFTLPSYTWYHFDGVNTTEITEGGDYGFAFSGLGNSRLIINNGGGYNEYLTNLEGDQFYAQAWRDEDCYTGGFSGTASLTRVYEAPEFTTQPQNYAVCENNGASFTASFTANVSGENLSYQWMVDPDISGFDWADVTNGSNFTGVTFSGATTKTLWITVGESAANNIDNWLFKLKAYSQYCDDAESNEVNIEYNVDPTVTISWEGDGEICDGETERIVVDANGGETFIYEYNFRPLFSDIQGTTISGMITDDYGFDGFTTAQLTITGNHAQAAYREFRAVVINACGTATSNWLTLTVGKEPEFLTDAWPSNPEVCEYDEVYFYATFTETSPTEYQWYRSTNGGNDWFALENGGYGAGDEFYYGVTTTSLWVTHPPREISGYQFKLYAENTCGWDYSTAVTMDVIYTPEFDIQPEDAHVCETYCDDDTPNEADFYAHAIGSTQSVISYIWVFSSNEGSSWSDITNLTDCAFDDFSGETTSHLTVTARYNYNNYLFRADATNICGTGESETARLTIQSMPSFDIDDEVSMDESGGKVDSEDDHGWACVGGWFELFGHMSTGTLGLENMEFQWRMDDMSTAESWEDITNGGMFSGATTTNLTISNVTAVMDSYRFQMWVYSPTCSNDGYATTEALTITVYTKPVFELQPDNTCICPNDVATFTSSATSNADINYQWQANNVANYVGGAWASGTWYDIADNAYFTGATTTELWVQNDNYEGWGFRLLASNSCADYVRSTVATFCVWDDPVITGLAPTSATVCFGGEVDIVATATGDNLSYTWYFGGPFDPIPSASGMEVEGNIEGASGYNSLTLSLPGDLDYNSYQFRLYINNGCTYTWSDYATLWVYPALEVVEHPSNETTCPEGTAEFMGSFNQIIPVNYDVELPVAYQWFMKSDPNDSPWDCEEPDAIAVVDGTQTFGDNEVTFTGATTTKLTIDGYLQQFNTYAFRLHAETVCDDACTDKAWLNSVGLGLEYCEPYEIDYYLCDDDSNVELICGSVSGSAPIVYQWQYNLDTDPYDWDEPYNWFDISQTVQLGAEWYGFTTRCLTVSEAPHSLDGVRLRLVASNLCGSLTFDEPSRLWIYDDPEFGLTLPPDVICEGTDADYVFTLNGAPEPLFYKLIRGLPGADWADVTDYNLTGATGWSEIASGSVMSATLATVTVTGDYDYDSYQYGLVGTIDPNDPNNECLYTKEGAHTLYVVPSVTFNEHDQSVLSCNGAATFETEVEYNTSDGEQHPEGTYTVMWKQSSNNGVDWYDVCASYASRTTSQLRLSGLGSAQNGWLYRLAVTSECGTTYSEIFTHWYMATPTMNNVTEEVCEGMDVDLEFTAAGGGLLSYHWEANQYCGVSTNFAPSFSGNGTVCFDNGDWNVDYPVTISINPVPTYGPSNTGFNVTVTYYNYPLSDDECGSFAGGEYCNTATYQYCIDINPAPTFTSHPTTQVGCVGFDATFEAETMDWAGTDYMWQVGNTQTGPWNDITSPQGTYIGYLTTQLIIDDAPAFLNGKWYRLQASTSNGCPTWSDAASLVVLGAPTMVFEEKDIDVCEGDDPTLVANVGALTLEHGLNTFFWQISTDDGNYWADLNQTHPDIARYDGWTTSALTIDPALRNMDGYQYVFCLENQCGFTCFDYEEVATLTVYTVPTVDCENQSCVDVDENIDAYCGDVITLSVNVDDGQNLENESIVEWFRVPYDTDPCATPTFANLVTSYTTTTGSGQYDLVVTVDGTTAYSYFASVSNQCGPAEYTGNCRTAITPVPALISCDQECGDSIYELCPDGSETFNAYATVTEDTFTGTGYTWYYINNNNGTSECNTGTAVTVGQNGVVSVNQNIVNGEMTSTIVVQPVIGTTYTYYAVFDDACFTPGDIDYNGNCRYTVEPIVSPSFSYMESRLNHLAVCAEQEASWYVYVTSDSYGWKTYQWWQKSPLPGSDWERIEGTIAVDYDGYDETYAMANTFTIPFVNYDIHNYSYRAEVFSECSDPSVSSDDVPADHIFNDRWTNASILTVNPALTWIEQPVDMLVCDNLNEYCFTAEVAGFNPTYSPISYQWYINPADVEDDADGSYTLDDCDESPSSGNTGWYPISAGEWGPYTGVNANSHYTGYNTPTLCFDDVINECDQDPCPTPIDGNKYILKVMDACGDCSYSDIVTLNVYPRPEVQCVLPDQTVCEDEETYIRANITNYDEFAGIEDHICFVWQISDYDAETGNPAWDDWTDIEDTPYAGYFDFLTFANNSYAHLVVTGNIDLDGWHYRAYVYDCACNTGNDAENPEIRSYSQNAVAVHVNPGLSFTSEGPWEHGEYCYDEYLYYITEGNRNTIDFTESVLPPSYPEDCSLAFQWYYYDHCTDTYGEISSDMWSGIGVNIEGWTTTRLRIYNNSEDVEYCYETGYEEPIQGIQRLNGYQFHMAASTDCCDDVHYGYFHTLTVYTAPSFYGAWTGNNGQPVTPDDPDDTDCEIIAEICANESTSFFSTVSFNNIPDVIRWEYNDGSGWETIQSGGENPRFQVSYPTPVLCPLYCYDVWETQPKLWIYDIPYGMDEWQFRLYVETEECGYETSDYATLIVHDAPYVDDFTYDITLCAGVGSDATFTSSIEATQELVSYRWWYSDDDGSTWSDISELNINTDPENSNTIPMDDESDEFVEINVYGNYVYNVSLWLEEPPYAYNQYQFMLESGYNGEDDDCGSYSNVATLFLHQSPLFSTQPDDIVVCEGNWGSFTAEVSNTAVYAYRWQYRTSPSGTWYFMVGNTNSDNDYDYPWSLNNEDDDDYDFDAESNVLWVQSNDDIDGYEYRALVTNECVTNHQSTPASIDNIELLSVYISSGSVCNPTEETLVNLYAYKLYGESATVTYRWEYKNGSNWTDDIEGEDWFEGMSTNQLTISDVITNEGTELRLVGGYDTDNEAANCPEVYDYYTIYYNVTPTVTIQIGEVAGPGANPDTEDAEHWYNGNPATACTFIGDYEEFATVPEVVVIGNHPGFMASVTINDNVDADCLDTPADGNVKSLQCVNSAVKYIAKIDDQTDKNGYVITWYYREDSGDNWKEITSGLPPGTDIPNHFSGWTTTALWVTAYGCCEWQYMAEISNECDDSESNVAIMELKRLDFVDIEEETTLCTDIENELYVFSSSISGDGPFTYQWQHLPLETSGQSWVEGDWVTLVDDDTYSNVTKSNLIVIGNAGHEFDMFRVQVNNFCGTEYSNAMSVTDIYYTPTVSLSEFNEWYCTPLTPDELTVTATQETGSSDIDMWQWYKSTNEGTDWDPLSDDATYSGTDTGELTISFDEDWNTFENTIYRVWFQSEEGCADYSDPTTAVEFYTEPIYSLTFNGDWNICANRTEPITYSVTGTVQFDGPDDAHVSYQWFVDGVEIDATTHSGIYDGFDTSVLTVNVPTNWNNLVGNEYTCEVTPSYCGYDTQTYGTGTISVIPLPVIIADPADAEACTTIGTAEFATEVETGSVVDAFIWQYLSADTPEDDDSWTNIVGNGPYGYDYAGFTTSKLEVSDITGYPTGDVTVPHFRCLVDHSCLEEPLQTEYAILSIVDEEPANAVLPDPLEVCSTSEYAYIEVENHDTNIASNYIWYYSTNSGTTWLLIDTEPGFSGINSETLVIDIADYPGYINDWFRVRASNACGNSPANSNAVQLISIDPLEVTLSADPEDICIDETSLIEADITGTPDAYAWTMNGSPITAVDSYLFDPTATGEYVFQITVTNICGDVESNEVTVTVHDVNYNDITANTVEYLGILTPTVDGYDYDICNTGSGYELTVNFDQYPELPAIDPVWMHSTDGTNWVTLFTGNPLVLPSEAAEGHQLYAVISDGYCSENSGTVTIRMNNAPTITYASGAMAEYDICIDADPIDLLVDYTGNTPDVYTWDVDVVTPIETLTGVFSFDPAVYGVGVHTVSVFATNDCGDSNILTFTVTVYSLSITEFGPFNDQDTWYQVMGGAALEFCSNDDGIHGIVLGYEALPTDNVTVTWYRVEDGDDVVVTDGDENQNTLLFGVEADGEQYYAILDDGVCEPLTSDMVTVIVNDPPALTLPTVADFCLEGFTSPIPITVTNSGGEVDSDYTWTITKDGEEYANTETTDTYDFMPTEAGVYTFQVEGSNECDDVVSNEITVTVYSLQVSGVTTSEVATGEFVDNVYSFCVNDNGIYQLEIIYTFAPGTVTPEWYNYDDELVATGDVFTIVTPVDGASFYVTIDGEDCGTYTSDIFSLDVNEAPAVSMNHPDDQILMLPEDTDNWFSVLDYATYSKDVVYQWKYDDGTEGDDDVANWPNVVDATDMYDGATTDILYITGTQDMDGYRYALVATNECGTDISQIGTLYFEGCAEVAEDMPEDASVAVGSGNTEEVTFTVELTEGDEDFVTYKWYVETVSDFTADPIEYNDPVMVTDGVFEDNSGVEFSGATTNELTVAITGGNPGWYMAKARFYAVVEDECIDEDDPETRHAVLDVFDAEPVAASYLQSVMSSFDVIYFEYTLPTALTGWFVMGEQTDEYIAQTLNDGEMYVEPESITVGEFGDVALAADVYLVGYGLTENDDVAEAIVTNLEPSTEYSFKVVTYNDGLGALTNYYNRNYNNDNATGNPANFTSGRMFTTDDQELPNKGGSELTSSNIMPNPASDQFSLNINLRSEQNVRIAMYDNEGKMILSIVDGQVLGSGDHTFNVMLQNIASGSYSILISAGEELIIEQIVVKK